MRIAIMYSPRHRTLEQAAKTLGKTLEESSHHAYYVPITKMDQPPNVRQYDFVYVGSVAEGMLGGKIPVEVGEYISQCRGFQRSKSAAFIMKRFWGNTKGLKRLMAILEHVGSQVIDFETIGSLSDAERLGKRFKG